jgi:hypothetical protein
MKMLKLFLILFFLMQWPLSGKSQNIDNASFDSLCICAIDRVYHWVTSDVYFINQDTAQPFTPNTHFTNATMELHFAINTVQLNYDDADSLGYVHSVKIFSRPGLCFPSGDNFRGFLINGDHFFTNGQGYIDLKRCGTAFAYRPDSISGIYKFEDSLSSVAEYGKVNVLLKKFNTANHSADTIAYAESLLEFSPALQWTQFKLPIHYISSSTPDSLVVAFFSSSNSGRPTSLWLDDIHFIYPTSGTEIYEDNFQQIIYPNPSGDLIYLTSAIQGPGKFEIYNIAGTLVQNGTFHNSINIKPLPKACYILKILQPGKPCLNFTFIKN